MKFRTRAIHVGNEKDPLTGAVVPPIYLASTFVQPGAGEWGTFDYGRSGNPTRANLERTLASLEGGSHALAFASGMASIHTALMLLELGDEILAGTDIYGGTYRILHKIIQRFGVSATQRRSLIQAYCDILRQSVFGIKDGAQHPNDVRVLLHITA